MRMNRERTIGIVLVLGSSLILTLLILFVVSPAIAIGLMAGMAVMGLIIRKSRPQMFNFLQNLKKTKDKSNDAEIDELLSREVFLTDLMLCSVNMKDECVFRITKKLMVIGVAEGCDMVMPPDSGASRIHAKIYYSNHNGQFWVEDNDSGNGSFLNRVRLVKGRPQVLCKGDRLRFANTEFIVKSAYNR